MNKKLFKPSDLNTVPTKLGFHSVLEEISHRLRTDFLKKTNTPFGLKESIFIEINLQDVIFKETLLYKKQIEEYFVDILEWDNFSIFSHDIKPVKKGEGASKPHRIKITASKPLS